MITPVISQQSGIALIVVLWALVLMTTLAGAVAMTQRTEVDLAKGLRAQAAARHLAEGGIHYAMYMLQPRGADAAWKPDGTARPFAFAGRTMRITVMEERGLVDINRANPALLRRLLVSAGVGDPDAERLIDAIEDWKDGDDSRRLKGAEAAEYRSRGVGYGPANTAFRDVAELRLVQGMTAAPYLRLRQWLTVDSGSAGVNVATAPAELRELLQGEAAVGKQSPARVRLTRLPGRGGIQFGGGLRGPARNAGLRIRIELMLDGGTRHVAEASVLPDNRDPNGFRIYRWHETALERDFVAAERTWTD